MEKLKLFITDQLKNSPEKELKDRIGEETFRTALRTSDSATMELLKKGYMDIAIIRNAVAYEALSQTGDIVLVASTGIASGDKLIWPAELGNTIWDGRRSPRLYTPFPNTMRADFKAANRVVPMVGKIEEPLNKGGINKVLEDFYSNGENPEQGPAFYGDINPEEIPNGMTKWNTSEWTCTPESNTGLNEYGIWMSAWLKEQIQFDEAPDTERLVRSFVRNFKNKFTEKQLFIFEGSGAPEVKLK